MNRLFVNADLGKQRISRHIYGSFAEHLGRCIYDGIWVGEDSPIPNTRGMRRDALDALTALHIPNLRWPGGCFADTYHWRDGIGPRKDRPCMVNVHWGGTTENNHFGTHEFMDLCSQIGTEPYICGNVGSGSVREMAEWLEYLTMPGKSPMADLRRVNGRDAPWSVPFWAVGNENWGCGGNMTALQYAGEYRKYQSYCRAFNGEKLYRVACGFDDPWNEIVMREAARFMDGLSVHYYTFTRSWEQKGPATGFPAQEWYSVMKNALGVEDFINRTAAIMSRSDPARRVGIVLDEWGTWYTVEPGTNPGFLYQQNTIRDALVAGASLNIFNRHADRIHIANIAQTVNVLQAVLLTEGSKMVLTPTYHVFRMYAVHQDALLLPTYLEEGAYEMDGAVLPKLSASASRDAAGAVHVSACNLHHEAAEELLIEVRGAEPSKVSGEILTGSEMDSRNDFTKPDAVKPRALDGLALSRAGVKVKLPPRSVVVVKLS
jgi:alpha-N-arabinofuranosidase